MRTDFGNRAAIVLLIVGCVFLLRPMQVSESCGIPDFRSRDAAYLPDIYARLAMEYPDLPDSEAMFNVEYFKNNPRPFFKVAKVSPTSTRK